MNLIVPKDLLPSVDHIRKHLSRAVFIIKCIAYIKIKGITLEDIENTIAAKYERAENDRLDRTGMEGKGRDKSTM
jgi:hypothetical protein